MVQVEPVVLEVLYWWNQPVCFGPFSTDMLVEYFDGAVEPLRCWVILLLIRYWVINKQIDSDTMDAFIVLCSNKLAYPLVIKWHFDPQRDTEERSLHEIHTPGNIQWSLGPSISLIFSRHVQKKKCFLVSRKITLLSSPFYGGFNKYDGRSGKRCAGFWRLLCHIGIGCHKCIQLRQLESN